MLRVPFDPPLGVKALDMRAFGGSDGSRDPRIGQRIFEG